MSSMNATVACASISHSASQSKLLSRYILIFAVAFAVFVMGPPFLGYKFSPYPPMHAADVLDLLTPLVLLPLYWLLFRVRPRQSWAALAPKDWR